MSASLETAAAMWWTALDAAESAIRAADRELTSEEKRELTGHLSAERAQTVKLLDAVAYAPGSRTCSFRARASTACSGFRRR